MQTPLIPTGFQQKEKRKPIRRLIRTVQRSGPVSDVTRIYIATGWLTPTIALVFLTRLVQMAQTGTRLVSQRLPRKGTK